MHTDSKKHDTPTDANNVLADGLSADNPFRKIIGWYVGDIERSMQFDSIPYTSEHLKEFRNNYSDCMECGQWYKHTDFSSFSLGSVICKNCDH